MSRIVSLATACVFGLFVSAAAQAQQETAYVTDVLRLGIHKAPDTSDRSFRALESGQSMTILSRDSNYAHVRLPDGTEGYVKVRFTVDEKPARLVVAETLAEAETLRATLAEVRSEFSGSAERIDTLTRDLQAATASAATLQADLDRVTEQNTEYEQKMRGFGFSLPWPIALGAMLVALALGFAGGFWWIDSRSRRRHGGFRIY